MGSVVACRTVRGGTGGGCRNENPTALLLLDRVQLEAGWVGEEGLHMARGRSHLPLINKTFHLFHVWGHLGRSKRARKLRENPFLASAETEKDHSPFPGTGEHQEDQSKRLTKRGFDRRAIYWYCFSQ
jgi:hypothetical protein